MSTRKERGEGMNGNLIFLVLSIVLGACGQVLLKLGVNHLGPINLSWPDLLNTALDIFTNWWIIFGIICFVSSMFLWIKVISEMELSRAYPSVSVSYVLVFIFSVLLFNESVSTSKVFGLILVSAGVYFLNI